MREGARARNEKNNKTASKNRLCCAIVLKKKEKTNKLLSDCMWQAKAAQKQLKAKIGRRRLWLLL